MGPIEFGYTFKIWLRLSSQSWHRPDADVLGVRPVLVRPVLLAKPKRDERAIGREPQGAERWIGEFREASAVRLWNWPDPTCVTQTSIGPSRSDRKATNCPSRDTAAACSRPSKSVTVWSRAPAIGSRQKYSVFLSQNPAAIARSATTTANGRVTLHGAGAETTERGDNAGTMGDGISLPLSLSLSLSCSCSTRTLRPRAHSSNSAVNA